MASNIQNDVEDESSSFDALAFAQNLYQVIDSYRSQMPANYFELTIAPTASSGNPGETKLNAFYRMIGLPAITNPSFIRENRENDEFSRTISQDGTLNYFHTLYGDELKDNVAFKKIRDRNDRLTTKPTAERFAEFMYKPIGLSEGMKDSSSGQSRRTSLFPLVVDAAVPVYPLSRRIAPSFQHTINGEDYIVSGSTTRLSRPLIDNIIYMRTKTINNEEGAAELAAQLKNLAESAGTDFSGNDVKKDIQDAGFTFIDLAIRTKLLQTLKSLSNKFKASVNEVQELSAEITFVFTPVSNPEMRSSQSYDIKSEHKAGSLDIEISRLESEIANQNGIVFLLPSEQVKRREEIRRLEHNISISNITQDVLISQLTSLLTYEVDNLNRKLAEKQHARDEKLSRAEELKRLLMYYTGEFSGLSIFDVICVIYGLFSVDSKYLVGLLNRDAQNRLTEDEFFRPPSSAQGSTSVESILGYTPPTVEKSLAALEEKVSEAFRIAEGFANTQASTQ